MSDKAFKLHCIHCGGETKIVIKVSAAKGKKGKKVQLPFYCEHCNGLNIVTVPEPWDKKGPVLGDDDVASLSDDTPILEGERP